MNCKQCQSKPVHIFTNKQQLCKQHFIRYFEKKIYYTIRKFSMLDNKDKILIKKSEKNFNILYPILKQLTQKRNIILTTNPKQKHNKLISGNSVDNQAYEIINTIITSSHKQLIKQNPVYKKTICPLYLLLDKEIKLYSKLKSIKNPIKPINSPLNNFINQLETKHPEVKNSIVKAYLKHL